MIETVATIRSFVAPFMSLSIPFHRLDGKNVTRVWPAQEISVAAGRAREVG
jgi:hypothetical protein